jgi:uncharacterized membrane protein
MYVEPLILVGVSALLIALGMVLVLVIKKDKNTKNKDYYSLFLMGLTWAVVGFLPINIDFLVIGVVFMILAWRHRKEWRKNYTPFGELSNKERWIRITLMLLVVLVLALSAIYYFWNNFAGL